MKELPPEKGAPAPRECIRLLRRYQVPIHIIRHCIKVKKVSDVLAARLTESGLRLDAGLVGAGAALHDIAKMRALHAGGGLRHAELGAEMLKEHGLRQVAEIVRQHVVLDQPAARYSRPDEAMVVNYADKRVRHTEIVTLEERFQDLFDRYGRDSDSMARIERLYEETRIMERLIFDIIGIEPDRLEF